MLGGVPRWVQNAAVVFAAGGWLTLGGFWVVVPDAMAVCLLAAAVSTSVAAVGGLRRSAWFVAGYGGLALLGFGLVAAQFAYGWEFVWPLSYIVLLYGQVTALLLGLVLVLANWPNLPRSIGIAGMTLVGVGVFLLELSLVGTGGLRVALAVLAGFLVFVGVGVAVTSAGGLKRTEFRILPWWSVPLGLAVIAVSIWASTSWLLHEAGQDPALRVDAIRTGLTVGAGAGGGTALLLAVRRQWLNERAQVHTESEAVERRVTELFSTAAEHLGHDKAAVRLAGLKTLERLGQDHAEQRQTIVDLVCAYLRMPFKHPDDIPPEAYHIVDDLDLDPDTIAAIEAADQELQVRLAAQDLLVRHLMAGEDARSSTQWPGMRVPLSGATLVDFQLSEAEMSFLDCRSARFIGEAFFTSSAFEAVDFSGARFRRGVSFEGCQFGMANFTRCHFEADTSFRNVTFRHDVSFRNVSFKRAPDLEGACGPTAEDWRSQVASGVEDRTG